MIEPEHAFFNKLQQSGNKLLVKDTLGKPKKGTIHLPPSDFSYGIPPKTDPEGVAALVSSWHEAQPNRFRAQERDYRRLNIMSVGKQCITSKQVREFHSSTDVRLKQGNGHRKQQNVSSYQTFGHKNKPGTPISQVISNYYGNNALEMINTSYLEDNIKPIRQNRNSVINRQHVKQNNQQPSSSMFKLKRFMKVPAKIRLQKQLSKLDQI